MAAQLNAAGEERDPADMDGSTRRQQHEDASEAMQSETVAPTRTVS